MTTTYRQGDAARRHRRARRIAFAVGLLIAGAFGALVIAFGLALTEGLGW